MGKWESILRSAPRHGGSNTGRFLRWHPPIPSDVTGDTDHRQHNFPGDAFCRFGGRGFGFQNYTSREATPEKIAFSVCTGGTTCQIFTMNTDGTGVTQLTDAAGFNTEPRFNRQGTRIVFTSSRDGNNQIYVMNSDGSGQHDSRPTRHRMLIRTSVLTVRRSSSGRTGTTSTERFTSWT